MGGQPVASLVPALAAAPWRPAGQGTAAVLVSHGRS
jgi:hypothetical protein